MGVVRGKIYSEVTEYASVGLSTSGDFKDDLFSLIICFFLVYSIIFLHKEKVILNDS